MACRLLELQLFLGLQCIMHSTLGLLLRVSIVPNVDASEWVLRKAGN